MSGLQSSAAILAIIVAGLWAVPTPTLAQGAAPAPGVTSRPSGPEGQAIPGIPEGRDEVGSGSSSEPLSDKLDRSSGVIRPPSGVDSGLTQTPPAAGPRSTPVIPPPGTPGGEPGITAK